MKVKYAVQILSNTTASAIKAVCSDPNNNLFSQSDIIKYALPTAKICEMFNNCFDCFNKVSIFNKDFESIDEKSLRYFLGFCLIKLKNCIDSQEYKNLQQLKM